jgi:hypothetical protein
MIGVARLQSGSHSSPLIICCMDRYKGKFVAMLVVLTTLVSCVKDPQDIPSGGVINDPVFRLDGNFDNSTVNIEAGNMDWTAVPATGSINSALVYSSTLSINGCTSQCTPSWTFNVYQSLPASPNANESFLNTFHQGALGLVPSDEELIAYDIQVQTHTDLFYSNYSSWVDLNNPQDSFGSVFTTGVGYGETLECCFHSYSPLGCQYNQCISFDPSTLVPCTGYIVTELLDSTERTLSMTVRPQGTPPFQVEWMNGEKTTGIVVHLLGGVSTAYADVKVTDANGNRFEITQNILVDPAFPFPDACYFPIEVFSTPIGGVQPEQLAGRLEIIHIDSEGNEWRSTAAPQPQNAFASVGPVDYFGISPTAEQAYKVGMQVMVLLTNPATGESKLFEAQELVLPFSYPE